MKALILILAILLFPTITALEFYPSSLTIKLEQNEHTCRTVFFELDNPATIIDEWATNPSILWSVAYFDKTADYHNLQTNYPSQVSTEDTQAEFCISGSKPGEYRGALVFRQQREGNSIVQFAIWIKLTISGNEIPIPDQPINETNSSDNNNSSDSSSGSSSSRRSISPQVSNNPDQTQLLVFQSNPKEEITLEGSPKKSNKTLIILSMITTSLIAVFLIVLLIVRKPRKDHEEV